jgi:flagella basal body P-ring formation protein FlgA
MKKVLFTCLVAGLTMIVSLVAQGETCESTATFVIPETVVVGGPKIFFSDLGTIQSGQTDFEDFLKRVDLGAAPAPGEVRTFNREYLNSIIRQNRFPIAISLQMGEQVAVKSIATCIQGVEIEKAIQNLFAEKKTNIIKKWVELHNLPETIWLSHGEWKIAVFPIGNLPEVGNALFKVILTKDKENKTINISGKIRATALVYRTLRNISNQTAINQRDFELMEMELATGKELVGAIPGQTRATKFIKQGEILRTDWLQPIPLVCKDHAVKVIVKDENVVIKIVGVAKVDGWLGDEILISNPDSNKVFRAKVIGNGVAEVNL